MIMLACGFGGLAFRLFCGLLFVCGYCWFCLLIWICCALVFSFGVESGLCI